MRKYVAIAITILGALLVLFSSLGITQQLNDEDTVEAMLPRALLRMAYHLLVKMK